MKAKYSLEYPCGLKISVSLDAYLATFDLPNELEPCPLHGTRCKARG